MERSRLDGTAVLITSAASPGTELTQQVARRLGRPVYLWHLDALPDSDAFRHWLQMHKIRTLNVAGPRESESPGVYTSACAWLRAALPSCTHGIARS